MTFMSPDLWNHVLSRVRHLVNIIVVFPESHVFSSLAKLLHLATRIKVEHKTNLLEILSYGRLFKWSNWSCGVWHSWRACHSLAALANLERWNWAFRDSIRHRWPETATSGKISLQPHTLIMHTNFDCIHMNCSCEILWKCCMHNKCMGLCGNLTQRALLLHLAGPGVREIFLAIPEETKGDA